MKTAARRSSGALLRLARAMARVRADVPLVLLDVLLCIGAYGAVLVLRFEGSVADRYWDLFPRFVPLAVATHLAANWMWQLYGQIWKHASVQEARRVLLAGALSIAILLVPMAVGVPTMPRSVVVLGGIIATLLMGAVRFQSRLFAVHRRADAPFGTRIAVIGAGDSGAAVVREMLRKTDPDLHPVLFLDDDPRKQGRSVLGVPVAGGLGDLARLAPLHDVHEVLLAIASATSDVVKRADEAARGAGLPLRVLPSVGELVRGQVSVRDVRELRIEDLLGRQQVTTDLEAVSQLLNGRRVLVTGGGGSIGAEIVRQVAACSPLELLVLDHDETHLYELTEVLEGEAQPVLADIRDAAELDRVLNRHRPEVVFHAAAHKHVPMLETHACEAARTNVFGTRNLLRSAACHGVDHLVVISTDKAVRPSSVMGASKWVSEQLLLEHVPAGSPWCAVRFGNVLGSRGSVIPTFARQIEAGGPVTVTDHRMSRFFMSIHEAVQLVLQASVLAKTGDILMLEMGEPVNIYDLAIRMIRLSGREVGTEIPVVVTGRRSGEKLVEELSAPGEARLHTLHPAIVRLRSVRAPGPMLHAALDQLAMAAGQGDDGRAAEILMQLPFASESVATGSRGSAA